MNGKVRPTMGFIALISSSIAAMAQQQNPDVTIIADQVRSQGIACTNPSSVELIEAESAPDLPVYILKCENATYKVHVIPDQAAKVTEIK